MTLDTFFQHFDRFAEAPNAVAKMRELILQLAVQGKLVGQDHSEGAASSDIDQAVAFRDAFRSKHKIRNRKSKGPLRADEIPFNIPENWAWSRFEKIACYIQRGKGPKYASTGRAKVVSQKCIQWSGFDLSPARIIDDLSINKYGEERFLKENDLLWNSTGTGTAGRIALFSKSDDLIVADSHVTVIRLSNFVPQYIWCYIASPAIQSKMAPNEDGSMVSGTTNQVELSTTKVTELAIPCPPLAEQKRIVAKVDELMALCDTLGEKQRERDRLFPLLSQSAHARFVASPSPENLEALFAESTPVSPDDVRKTILSLAVQGRVVPQEETDEHAKHLYARIIKARCQAGEKEFGRIPETEATYEIPESWLWVKMGNLALSSDAGWSPRCESMPRIDNNWGVLKVSAVSWGKFNPNENKALPVGMDARPGCEVHAGDFLLSRANTEELVARSVVVEQTPPKLMMSDKIVRFRFHAEISKEYINLANLNHTARSYYAKNASGTSSSMKNVGRMVMCNLPIPLPPLTEQQRIVAKVDELMVLVDRLEKQQNQKNEVAALYAQTAVGEMTGTEIKEQEKMKAPKAE